MLGKLCHIVLSHPTRKFAFPWTFVLYLQLDDPELLGRGAEGSSLPHLVTIFRVSALPISLSLTDILLY